MVTTVTNSTLDSNLSHMFPVFVPIQSRPKIPKTRICSTVIVQNFCTRYHFLYEDMDLPIPCSLLNTLTPDTTLYLAKPLEMQVNQTVPAKTQCLITLDQSQKTVFLVLQLGPVFL